MSRVNLDRVHSVQDNARPRMHPMMDDPNDAESSARRLALRDGPENALLREVLETALDGVMVLRAVRGEDQALTDFEYVYVNEAAAGLAGIARDATVGHTLGDVLPALRDVLFALFAEVLATGDPGAREVTLGEPARQLAVRAVRVSDGVSVTLGDAEASEQWRQSHEGLQSATASEPAELFRTLVNTMPVLAWTADPDGNIDWYNDRWYEYTGTTLEAQRGWQWQSVHDPDDAPRVVDVWKQALATGDSWEDTFRLRRARDGMYRWHLSRASAVRDEHGTIVRWVGTNVDVDDQKRAEAQLALLANTSRTLAESEARARTEAESANRAKDIFLATVSHELRTPLTAILGWSRLLRSGSVAVDKVERAIETIERNATAQLQLVEDLLDISRIVSGQLRLAVEPILLGPVIEASLEAVRPAAGAKNVRIQTVLDPDAGTVMGDASRLQQVVWNLLANAVKFTPKGGRVHVQLRRGASEVEIVVADNGQGIEPSFLPFVFDRFRQQDEQITRGHGGLGLGLAIVRHLVELHGGSVTAESAGTGKGARFVVRIPIAPVRTTPVPVAPETIPATAFECPAELDGLEVLVVDDEEDTRLLLREVLEHCRARVTTAASVAEALEVISRALPSVIVSDVGMPVETGYDLVRRVRALPPEQGGRIPTIALTAYARQEDRLRAFTAGFAAHVVKPVDPAELVLVVANLAGRLSRT